MKVEHKHGMFSLWIIILSEDYRAEIRKQSSFIKNARWKQLKKNAHQILTSVFFNEVCKLIADFETDCSVFSFTNCCIIV